MVLPTYRPSGRLGALTPVLFVGLTLAGVAVAWLYQLGVRSIPWIQLDALLVMVFGALLGAFGGLAIERGHCRNRVIAFSLAALAGACAWIASFYWDYLHYVSSHDLTFGAFVSSSAWPGGNSTAADRPGPGRRMRCGGSKARRSSELLR